MDWKRTTAKFDSTCRHCLAKIPAGKPAVMRKKMSTGKWQILCSSCYTADKASFDSEADIETSAHTGLFTNDNAELPGTVGTTSGANLFDIADQIKNLEKVMGGTKASGWTGDTLDTLKTANDAADRIDNIAAIDPDGRPYSEIFFGGSGDQPKEPQPTPKEPQPTKAPAKEDQPPAPKYTKRYIEQNPEWRI